MGDRWLLSVLVLTAVGWEAGAQTVGYENPACGGKAVIVHLFEWRWTDVALECERFLSQTGFCGVQVSPPNEHAVITTDYPHPWWQRYQPISYKLHSRSGTEQEFIDMVQRCNAVGVRVFVDAVVNHMAGLGRSGKGSAGSNFDSDELDFPDVPYTAQDFTPKNLCPSGDGMVNNYGDPNNVRNCYLVGLTDLYGASQHVREMVSGYFNKLVDIGVAGFRIDASKHMWPQDLEAMMNMTNDLNISEGFPGGTRPFFYHEVIDRNDGAVTVQQYYGLGRVTEFRYTQKVAWGVQDPSKLNGVYDPGWGMADPEKAFVFVDNHDNQRGHGGSGDTLTHKTPKEYRLGVAFTLAQPYGFTRIMSSYSFGEDSDQGPPHLPDYTTAHVPINSDNQCEGGWVCEHRWISIYKMVQFRNAVAGSGWWENYYSDGNIVAFSRGSTGFFAMIKYGTMTQDFQTGMPAGTYQDLVSCQSVTVGSDGNAQVSITNEEEPVFAICVGCDCSEPPVVTGTPSPNPMATTTANSALSTDSTDASSPFISTDPTDASNSVVSTDSSDATSPFISTDSTDTTTSFSTASTDLTGPTDTTASPITSESTITTAAISSTTANATDDIRRTIIFLYKPTSDGQDLFIRGGIDITHRPGCTDNTATDPCAIDISISSLGTTPHYDKYNSWRVGDDHLDWNGAEPGQGTYSGLVAFGTPMAWTSNNPSNSGYQDLNTFGDHYWMVDVDMDCSETVDGWFEFKGFLTNGGGWENDISQIAVCSGNITSDLPPYATKNHFGKCGTMNVFYFDSSSCLIESIPQ